MKVRSLPRDPGPAGGNTLLPPLAAATPLSEDTVATGW